MSENIDKRVVEMQFDNKQFENGIQSSVKSLNTLKQNLNLEKSAKSLASLERAGKSFSLDGISAGVDAISSRFSTLGIIGVTALQHITNSAINCGKQMASALTVDPIKSGFSEYETQINSVQTILANTSSEMDKAGYSDQERLDLVNQKLDELNAYADKTIYNFTEMTRNIGTFTSAGVDLETSVSSIQGIANLAAVSGSNSEQASRAMYQLSQALASGTVKLMDWNSVVNAGMGGELFQQALMRTADAMGVVGDDAKEMFAKLKKGQVSFRDSLSSGWLSSDILTQTLSQLSMDFETMAEEQGKTVEQIKEQTKAQLLAQGYSSDEAEEIINLAETATDAATKVKTLTQLFDTLKEAMQSGWTASWELIIGDFNEAQELLTGISEYFGEIIGASANSRNAILADWKALGGRNQLIAGFKNIIQAIENIVHTVRGAFQEIFPPATGKQLFNLTKGFNDFTAKIKNATENAEAMDKLKRIFRGAAAGLDLLRTAAGWVWNGFKQITGIAGPAAEGLFEFAAGVGDYIAGVRDSLKSSELFQNILSNIGKAIESVRGLFTGAFGEIFRFFGKIGARIQGSGLLTQFGEGVNQFIAAIPGHIEKIKAWGQSIIQYVKNSEALSKSWTNASAFFNASIQKIQEFGERLRGALEALFGADASGTERLGEKLKTMLSEFEKSFSGGIEQAKAGIAQKWEELKAFVTNFFTRTVPGFFNSAGFQAGELAKKIQGFDWGGLLKAAFGLAAGVKALSALGGIASFGKGVKKIGKGFEGLAEGIKKIGKEGITLTKENEDSLGGTMLKVAASIGILTASLLVLAKMDTADALKGITVITVLGLELLTASLLFKKIGANTGGLLKVSLAVALLAIPISILGGMDTHKAVKGVLAIGVILTELALFTRLAKETSLKATSLMGLALAMAAFARTMGKIGEMKTGTLIKGLAGMGAMMLELSLFMKSAGKAKQTKGLISMAAAVNLMVLAVKNMGKMNGKSIAKGIIGLGGVMAAFSLMMNSAKGFGAGNSLATILTLLSTLWVIIEAFKQVEGMDTESTLRFALSFSAVMLAMSKAMEIMSKIPITGALTGIANFAILIAGLGGILGALGWLSTQWGGMTGFLKDGGAVLELIGSALGKFVGGIANGFVEGLDLPEIGTELSDFMTNSKGFVEGAKNIPSSVSTGIGYLTDAIIGIAKSEFLTALAGIFTGENPITKFSKDLVQLGLGLSGFGLSVLPLQAVPETLLNRAVKTAGALADVANKIPATGNLVSLFNGVGDMGKFATDVEDLGGALVSFGEIVSASGTEGTDETKVFDDEKIDSVISIAEGLSELESNLEGKGGLEDALEGIKDLATFGNGLDDFAGGLDKFFEEIGGITYNPETDAKKFEAIIGIASELSKLESELEGQGGGEDALEGIRSLAAFSAGFQPFGDNLNEFIKDVNLIEYDPEGEQALKMAALINLAGSLSDLEKNLEGYGGFSDLFGGIQSLALFGDNLPDFATGLNTFITTLSGLKDEEYDQGKIDKAKEIAEALSTFEKSLDPHDGFWQSMTGDQDLGSFGTNLQTLGEGLGEFAKAVSSVDTGDSEDAIEVLELINDFVGELEKEGGVWQNIGDYFNGSQTNTLLTIVGNIETVGKSLRSFSDDVTGLNTDGVATASEIFGAIETFMGGLDKSGSVWDAWNEFWGGGEENTLLTTSGTMAKVGSNIRTFADGLNGVTTESATIMTQTVGAFSNVVREMSGIEQVYDLSDYIKWLAEDVAVFFERTSGIDYTSAQGVTSAIKNLAEAAVSASGLGDGGASGLQSLLSSLSEASIPDFETSGTQAALGYISNLSAGIQNGAGTVRRSALSLSGEGTSALSFTYKTWKITGQNLALGLSGGISSMAESVKTAARNAASGAVQAIEITWSVHSPSRVGADLGKNWDLGLAQGIDQYASAVKISSEKAGRGAVESAKTLLTGLDSSLFNQMDAAPVIRPVLDDSGIRRGASAINSLFNANPHMGGWLSGGADFARSAGAKVSGGTRDSGVIAELRNLREQIGELNQAVSNMRVVLDTGVLVGQTSAKMDRQLGALANRRGRGN